MRRYVHEAVVDTPPDRLWRAIVARKVAQDAGAQTEAFMRFAERLP
jgi:hypothetical protein